MLPGQQIGRFIEFLLRAEIAMRQSEMPLNVMDRTFHERSNP
jgi:hypothetical protein